MNLAHSVREISPHFIQAVNYGSRSWILMILAYNLCHWISYIWMSNFWLFWKFWTVNYSWFLVLLGWNRSRTSVRSAILTNSRAMFIYNWTWKAHFGVLPGFRSRQGPVLGFSIQKGLHMVWFIRISTPCETSSLEIRRISNV